MSKPWENHQKRPWERQADREPVADGVGSLQAAIIAAGKTTDTAIANAKKLNNSMDVAREWNQFIPPSPERDAQVRAETASKNQAISQEQARARELYQPLIDQHPYSTLAGEIAPTLAVAPVSLPASMVAGAAVGGMTSDNNNTDTALLSAGAAALPFGIGKTYGRLRPKSAGGTASPSDEYAKQVATLEGKGVPLTTGQKTGTNWLKSGERTLAEVPFTGVPVQKTFEQQQREYQRQLLKMAGLDDGSDLITGDTLKTAKDVLSKKYSQALDGKYLDMSDNAFLDGLSEIEAKHSSFLPFEQKKGVQEIISGFLDEAAELETKGGGLSGEAYQRIRSNIGEKARSTKNTYQSALYDDLKVALDDLFASKAGAAKFDVDKQYAHLKQLDDIYNNIGGAQMSEGFISPVQVAKQSSKKPSTQEWKDFARAGSAVLPDRMGNSGTAQRNFMLSLLGGGTGTTMVIDPVTGVLTPLAGRATMEMLGRGVKPPVLPPLKPSARSTSLLGSRSVPASENR